MDYQKLFLQRWKELENEIELEKEDGETSFLEKDIFFKYMMTGLMTAKILRLKQKLFSKSI